MPNFEHKLTTTGSREKDLSAAEVLGKLHDLKKPERPEEASPEFVKLALDLVTDLDNIYKSELREKCLSEIEIPIKPGYTFFKQIGSGNDVYFVFYRQDIHSEEPIPVMFDSRGNEIKATFEQDPGQEERALLIKVEDIQKEQTTIYSTTNNCKVTFPGYDNSGFPPIQEQGEGFYQDQIRDIVVIGKNGLRVNVPMKDYTKIKNVICTADDVIVDCIDFKKGKVTAERIITSSGKTYGGEGAKNLQLWNYDGEWKAFWQKGNKLTYEYFLADKDGKKVFKTELWPPSSAKYINRTIVFTSLIGGKEQVFGLSGKKISSNEYHTHSKYNNKIYHFVKDKKPYLVLDEQGNEIGWFDKHLMGIDGKLYLLKAVDQGVLVFNDEGKQIGGPFAKVDAVTTIGGKPIFAERTNSVKVFDANNNYFDLPQSPTINIFDCDGEPYFVIENRIYNKDGKVIIKELPNKNVLKIVGMFKINQKPCVDLNFGFVSGRVEPMTNVRRVMKEGKFCLSFLQEEYCQRVVVNNEQYFIGVPFPDGKKVAVYNSDFQDTGFHYDKVLSTEVVGGKLYVTGMRDDLLVRERIE